MSLLLQAYVMCVLDYDFMVLEIAKKERKISFVVWVLYLLERKDFSRPFSRILPF